jgi:hypothetical protein
LYLHVYLYFLSEQVEEEEESKGEEATEESKSEEATEVSSV